MIDKKYQCKDCGLEKNKNPIKRYTKLPNQPKTKTVWRGSCSGCKRRLVGKEWVD